MRIAYSCAGEGFGHVARMIAIAPHVEKGNDVFYFVPNPIREFAGIRLGRGRTRWLPYFSFVHDGDRIRLWKTFGRSLGLAARLPALIIALAAKLRRMRIEAVISDFDPFLPRAARLCGIPVLQFNHPGIIQKFPFLSPAAVAEIAASRFLEGPFDSRIHSSFYGGDVGPLIRERLLSLPRTRGKYLLVNVKSAMRSSLSGILESCGVPFRFFPNPEGDYDAALAGCLAVISTAGHQTIAESLALGKPILVLPHRGQYEQELNARMLRESGAGMSASFREFRMDLRRFMAGIDSFSAVTAGKRGFLVTDDTERTATRISRTLEAIVAAATGPRRDATVGHA